MNRELPDVQAGFRKGRGTRNQIVNICWIMEKARVPSTSGLLTMPKPLTVWITINCGKFWKRWEYQTTWPASWRRKVAQLCPTLCDPMDCSLPGSSLHGILQARVLEWIAISFSRGSSRPRDRTLVSCISGKHFNLWATREVPTCLLRNLYTGQEATVRTGHGTTD